MLTSTTLKYTKFQNYLLIFVVSLCISSCAKDELAIVQRAVVVDNDLQKYFTLFEAEGKARGIDVDLAAAQIAGEIITIQEEQVVGQCSVNTSTGEKILRIDKTYWTKATAMQREFLIFHELGHCFLDRAHIDRADGNGNCESMMHSGLRDCKFSYTPASRAAYLDELFE